MSWQSEIEVGASPVVALVLKSDGTWVVDPRAQSASTPATSGTWSRDDDGATIVSYYGGTWLYILNFDPEGAITGATFVAHSLVGMRKGLPEGVHPVEVYRKRGEDGSLFEGTVGVIQDHMRTFERLKRQLRP